MFGSVSDLVLKAKQPPYKVATHTGSLVFSNLTGEFYPCKPDIFHLTYDEVTE